MIVKKTTKLDESVLVGRGERNVEEMLGDMDVAKKLFENFHPYTAWHILNGYLAVVHPIFRKFIVKGFN